MQTRGVFGADLSRRIQRGATLVEFAAILLPLMILFYGIVVYSLVFVTQQAVAHAAQRGADASVSIDPGLTASPATAEPGAGADFESLAGQLASSRVNALLNFLPGGADSVTAEVTEPPGANPARRVQVTVQYTFSKWGLPTPDFLPMPNLIEGVGMATVGGTGS